MILNSPQIQSRSLMNHLIEILEAGPDRNLFFTGYLAGKRVLHVGCTDYPRFNPEKNLHLDLCRAGLPVIHGLDIDAEGIATLKQHVDQPLFSSYDDVQGPYDVVLVPEVMEHVPNPGLFLQQLMAIDAREILLTVPNAIDIVKFNAGKFGWVEAGGKRLYQETTHRDHCFYFSPMTLATLVQSAIDQGGPAPWHLGPLFLSGVSVGCVVRRN